MSSTVVRAEKMAAGGDAIARLDDGRVAFVHGALPGELVEIEVVQAKKDFVRGEVLQVIEPSNHRVAPPCPAHTATSLELSPVASIIATHACRRLCAVRLS